MSFSSDLVAYLKTKTAITDLVGSGGSARISPAKINQGDGFPAIRFVITGGESHESLTGAVGNRQPNLQIDCYATTRLAATNLGEQVRLVLQGYRGTMGSTFINGITLENRFELYEPTVDGSDNGKHREVLVFNVVHDESIPSY